MARHGYADYLLVVNRLDESVDQVLRGRQSNPLSPLSNAVVVGHFYIARRYGEAIAEGEKLLAVDPSYLAVRNFIRRSYWQMGEREKSLAMLRETPWAQQRTVSAALDLGYAGGGPEGAMAAVADILEAQADTTYVDPLDIAVYRARGEQYDAAMDWLDLAESELSPTLVHVLLDPCFDAIRDSERFKALRERMNLPR